MELVPREPHKLEILGSNPSAATWGRYGSLTVDSPPAQDGLSTNTMVPGSTTG